eukprot:gene13047-3585_t
MAMNSRDIPSTDHYEDCGSAEDTFIPPCPETVLSTCQSPSKASRSAEDPFMPPCSETIHSQLFRDSAEVGGAVLPTWQSKTLGLENMDAAILSTRHSKTCDSTENNAAICSTSHSKASAEKKSSSPASSDSKACQLSAGTQDFRDLSFALACSDSKACHSAGDKSAPFASFNDKACHSAENKEAHLSFALTCSDSKACHSAGDSPKSAPLVSFNYYNAVQSAKNKAALVSSAIQIASSDPKVCESAEDKTAPLDSFNANVFQSAKNKAALLSSAIQIAISDPKASESAERSGLLSSALASSRLASSRLASSSLSSFHSKTWWENCFSHVEMPAEGARGIKPEDSPYRGLLIMGNVGEHDKCDRGCDNDDYKSLSRSTSLHLPCLEPSSPEPTIGRLILVDSSPEDDCFTPSGSAPGNGSDKAQNMSDSTNTAHRFPPINFNFRRCQSARPSVPLFNRTSPRLHGQKSLQLSFPRASTACPSPQATRRRLTSPSRQPKTRNAKLIALGPHICEMDFTPCTNFVPPFVAHKRPVLASFSTDNLEGLLRHSTRFARQSGAAPVSSQSGAAPVSSQSGAAPVSSQSGARPIYQPESGARSRTAGVYKVLTP